MRSTTARGDPMAVREAEPVGSLQEVHDAGLDREDLFGIYRNMLTARGIEERGHILYKQGKIPGSFYTGPRQRGLGRRRGDGDGAGRRRLPAAARHGRAHHPRRRAVEDLRAVHGARRRARRTAATGTCTSATPGSACTRWSAICPRCFPSPSGWGSRSGSARSAASRSPGAARAPQPAATRTRG